MWRTRLALFTVFFDSLRDLVAVEDTERYLAGKISLTFPFTHVNDEERSYDKDKCITTRQLVLMS